MGTHRLPRRGSVVIGRAADCDVRIDDPAISRRHAIVRVSASAERALTIEDLGSANGTFLRGPRAARPLPSRYAGGPAAVRLEPGERAPLRLREFVDVGGALLSVWPGSTPALPRRRVGGAHPIVVRDEGMRRLIAVLERVAGGSASVVLQGEPGVGKRTLAEEIHRMSPRAAGPFLRVGCRAISDDDLEEVLFGAGRGAGPGGMLLRARGGTLFLDDVAELSPRLQRRLLSTIEAVEEDEPRSERRRRRGPAADVRLVSATPRDLEAEVARGLFLRGLFSRLGGVVLVVPPLRARVSDVEPLARAFVAEAARAAGHPAPSISDDLLVRLARYKWRENVRELRGVMGAALRRCGGGELTAAHLPPALFG